MKPISVRVISYEIYYIVRTIFSKIIEELIYVKRKKRIKRNLLLASWVSHGNYGPREKWRYNLPQYAWSHGGTRQGRFIEHRGSVREGRTPAGGLMADWQFEDLPLALVEHGLTQRDQFNNDDVELAEALVREVIQNSTDAAAGSAQVKVRFVLRELTREVALQLRALFDGLRPHLRACRVDLAPLDRQAVRVLVIEDFGTKGLTGNPAARDNDNFNRFWRQHGISGKGGKSGGRWGLGKLVFSCSSEIKAFFGLTVRAGDNAPLLMGQAVLSNHELDGRRHPAHGFWFSARASNTLQLPVTDAATISDFVKLSGITRDTQTGLSLVVPYLNANVTAETLISGVVRNYYFPILAGRLSVEVGSVIIDSASFHKIAAAHISTANIPLGFVERVSRVLDSEPAFVAKRPINAAGLTEDCFEPDQLASMKASYGKYELLHVRVPVQLKRKDGSNPSSHIDLFLTPLPEGARPFALFARGSITVPAEMKFFGGAPAYGAMVASDDAVVTFLGDAENPAHTGWNANAEKLDANWRSPSQTLRHIRHALRELYTLVADRVEDEDKDALIDFFSLLDQNRAARGPKKRTPILPPDLPKREKALIIRSHAGGFAVVPGPGALKWKFPKIVDIRAAYDIVSGDPFKRHNKFDFDLAGDDIAIELQNANMSPLRPNKVRLSVTSADFRFEASGFDANRDLVVDARTVS